ncbi:MAG: MFS transporter, partial [Sphingomonas bacterium]|nr:MFS transporter [Sphingomonas bacterium]
MLNAMGLLKQRRFLPLFTTQFLGAFNDNLFKQAMVLFATYSIFN